ncbi:hypothetical protein [Flavobacterium suzhouense]|uniref:Lipoprotein n=1 Tax=Flavobacterium suzhouense TaxID=1529638 RepID=A0ABW5NS15_9FLAO
MKHNLFFKAAAAAILFAACSTEENATSNSTTNLKAKENGLSALQAKAVNKLTQHFTVSTNQERAAIKTNNGVIINFNPQQLTVNGHPVSGNVNIEYVEIFSLGDMVTANKTTMGFIGENNPDDPQMNRLFSGGEFYINVTTEEGQQVDEGTPVVLEVPKDLTSNEGSENDPGQDGMTTWESDGEDTNGDGAPDPEGDTKWDEKEDEQGNPDPVEENGDKYIFQVLSWGWCNIDKLDALPGQRTTIQIQVPTAYNPSNSKCYLAYQGISNSISPMDTFDYPNNRFNEHYGQVIVGMNAYAIFVTHDPVTGNWKYAIKPAVIAPNGLINITNADISTTTDAALISALNALP